MEPIVYDTVQDTARIDVAELTEFYTQQRHRITSSPEKLRRMLDSSFCFVTARRAGRLIGMARGVTDGFNGQLAECKLDIDFQGPGAVTHIDGRIEHDESDIAMEMATRVIDSLRENGVERIHVLAYGTEVDFCEELGFHKVGGMVALEMDTTAAVPAAPAPVG